MCEPRQAACMEKLLEATWMIPRLDLARSPRVTRARQTLLAKLIETQTTHLPVQAGWWDSSTKEQQLLKTQLSLCFSSQICSIF